MTTQQILKTYWGFDAFRPLQEDIINAVLDGKDCLALLPTGGGKSICFQVPAMAQDGICLVISPLIALMKDQVENLKRKGILALAVYSGMSFIETKKTLQNAAHGNYKFLYVSPERLETNLFLEYLPAMQINLIAVDEAHCISQWGYDFRPPYVRISNIRAQLPGIPVVALTASATKNVQDDICEKLLFTESQQRFQQSFERPNLSYSAFNSASKQNKLIEILQNVKGSAIVYCKSRKHTKDVADLLNLNRINAAFYHAGLSSADRNTRQESWINNNTRVITSTNAFGMGIDKPDVRVVVHYDVPDCLENYYQEAGRAGRDGKRAYAVLLFNQKELQNLEEQTNIRFPDRTVIKQVYTAVMNHLQIPAGSGEGISYDFDLGLFSTAFKIDALTANYAIKTLEQEGLLVFNESFYKPSTLVFTCDKNQLNEFENQHPDLEPTIKALLRSYEGIFDFPASINETMLANFSRQQKDIVGRHLVQLNQFGIVAYNPQKEKPQITLLQNRMYADSFIINLDNYLLRKNQFEERVKFITSFTNNSLQCRSRIIANYFNDKTTKNCGICDNCINQKIIEISDVEFNEIATHIFNGINLQKNNMQQLLAASKAIKKEKFWQVFTFLESEKKITVNKNGELLVLNSKL